MAKFNGTEGAPIDLKRAATWTENYRRQASAHEGVVVKAHFFGRDALQSLLDQEGSMGIRIYYARDESGQRQLVLVAADADGNDLTEVVINDSKICPPDCSGGGELNG